MARLTNLRFVIKTALCVGVVFFITYAGVGIDFARLEAKHGHREACFVKYKPGAVANFAELVRIRHRSGSVTVNYIMERTVLNVRYESEKDAETWLERVVRQLQRCNT